jgi:hypothetical protein
MSSVRFICGTCIFIHKNIGKKKFEFHGTEDTIYAAAMPMVELNPC